MATRTRLLLANGVENNLRQVEPTAVSGDMNTGKRKRALTINGNVVSLLPKRKFPSAARLLLSDLARIALTPVLARC